MNRGFKRRGAEFGLHPLIHTLLKFNLAQDIVSLNKRSRSSAVFLMTSIRDVYYGVLVLVDVLDAGKSLNSALSNAPLSTWSLCISSLLKRAY